MNARTIFHIDMDAFFASVEQKLRPELVGKPVIVGELSSARGVVSAGSYEARPFGIRAGMPLWEAKQRCPHAVFMPGNIEAYAKEALAALRIYQRFTPDVEPFSIDEAFLDVTGCLHMFDDAAAMAREIKRTVKAELGLSASVGIAPNRLVAKMVSDWDKPDGLTIIHPKDLPGVLRALPVSELWGVGESTAERLRRMGVRTIGDLEQVPLALLEREFGVIGRTLYNAARGLDDEPVRAYYEAKPVKSMGHELTLESDTSERAVLRLCLRALADKVARRLRREGYQGRTVTLRVKFADFKSITRSRSLAFYTDLEDVMFKHAFEMLSLLDLDGKRIRLVGIALSNLRRGRIGGQMSLFGPDLLKRSRLARAVDRVIERFGETAINRASLLEVRSRPLEDQRAKLHLDLEKLATHGVNR